MVFNLPELHFAVVFRNKVMELVELHWLRWSNDLFVSPKTAGSRRCDVAPPTVRWASYVTLPAGCRGDDGGMYEAAVRRLARTVAKSNT